MKSICALIRQKFEVIDLIFMIYSLSRSESVSRMGHRGANPRSSFGYSLIFLTVIVIRDYIHLFINNLEEKTIVFINK